MEKNNAVTGAFSRIQINATSYTEIDFHAMSYAQEPDHKTQCLRTSNTNFELVDISLVGADNLTLIYHISQGNAPPIVLELFHQAGFK